MALRFAQLVEGIGHFARNDRIRTNAGRAAVVRAIDEPVEHGIEQVGGSSYTPGKLLRHAVNGIASQSDRLLRLSIYVGFAFTAIAAVAIVVIIEEYFRVGFRPGWPSLFVLILFSTGLILSSIGILGVYIGKIFEQVKFRPLYHIDEATDADTVAQVAQLRASRTTANVADQ